MKEPNPRRVFLVNKLIDVGLTDEEYKEFDVLQTAAGKKWNLRRRQSRVNQTPEKDKS